MNSVVARYRNETKQIEVEIVEDHDNPISPMEEEDWVTFPTSAASEHRYGSCAVEAETLQALAKEARDEGGFAIPVRIRAQSYVIFTAGGADDEPQGNEYGYLIVTRNGLDQLGLSRKEAITQATVLLELYNQWANGYSWQALSYEIEKCNLGRWHRLNPERSSGYVAMDYEASGILEDANVRSGDPPTMNRDWEKVAS